MANGEKEEAQAPAPRGHKRMSSRTEIPSGSVDMSISTRPAKANATTNGGDAKYAAVTKGCTRASKFLFPERTAPSTGGGLAEPSWHW
jgi:hypothetical protein